MGKKRSKCTKKTKCTDLNSELSICQQSISENKSGSNCCEVDITNNENMLNVQSGVVFETYRPNTERLIGREYYVHSLCQVCKEDPKEIILCPKCRMVTYCSQKHRREHWPTHADVCAAVVQLCRDRQVDHVMLGAQYLSPDNYRTFRFQNMTECERLVERPLEKWEREMFIFPLVCVVCKAINTEKLLVCKNCLHVRYCNEHQTNNHQDWCKMLLRYKNIVKDQANSGVPSPSIPICKLSTTLPNLLNIEHFFKEVKPYINSYDYFELTDISTYPLTTVNVLLLLKNTKIPNQKYITLHIVGAETDCEIYKLEKWEYYILHLIPELTTLTIEFFGPELNTSLKNSPYTVCTQCQKANKSFIFNFHSSLYHKLCNSSKISKPNLICVFNPGLYRETGFDGQDTWAPTVKSMLGQDCPVLTTAYTCREVLMDVSTVKSTQSVQLEIEPVSNPFSSLKPSLNFVSDEESPVIFKNNFYCVMCKI